MNPEDPRNCWETPRKFWDVIQWEFAPTIDVAASAENAKCAQFFTRERSAFDRQWFSDDDSRECAWCNPPFKDLLGWAQLAFDQAQRYNRPVLLLGPLSDGEWLLEYAAQYATEIRDVRPRIEFIPPEGVTASTNSGKNVLVVFRRKLHLAPAYRFPWNWAAALRALETMGWMA